LSESQGGSEMRALSTNELDRLGDWVSARRDDIASNMESVSRLAFWTKVAQSLDAEALGVLLTAKEMNEERDTNTGILNRRGIESSLGDTLEWQVRSGLPVSLVLMDLDRFHAFNEAHGRQASDMVLGEWIGFLKGRMRRTDTIGRVGGQEVVAVLRGATEEQSVQMFDRIRSDMTAALKSTLDALGIDEPVTMSVGVAQHQEGGTAADLLDQVRIRTEQAKAAGRNLVVGGS
jgi:diguanylate cyclase (GGDEF)-like protein